MIQVQSDILLHFTIVFVLGILIGIISIIMLLSKKKCKCKCHDIQGAICSKCLHSKCNKSKGFEKQ